MPLTSSRMVMPTIEATMMPTITISAAISTNRMLEK